MMSITLMICAAGERGREERKLASTPLAQAKEGRERGGAYVLRYLARTRSGESRTRGKRSQAQSPSHRAPSAHQRGRKPTDLPPNTQKRREGRRTPHSAKYLSSLSSLSVRKQNMECSKGAIFFMATLAPELL